MDNQMLDIEVERTEPPGPPPFQGVAWKRDGITLAVGKVPKYTHPCIYSQQGGIVQVYAGCRTYADAYDFIAVMNHLLGLPPGARPGGEADGD